MNNLIVTVSLALIIGKSNCQYGTPVLSNQVTPTDSTLNSTNALAYNSSAISAHNPNNASITYNAPALGNMNTSLVGTSSPSLTSNTTNNQVYLMNEDIYLSTSNFSIYDQSGNITYQITKQQDGLQLSANEFVVQDSTGLKKLKIDTHVKACGFGQTYQADDGTKFRLDPRAFLSDRWYIKTSSSDSEYVYKRAALSVKGKIYENERMVAQITTGTNSTIATLATKQLTLESDGTIPPWDLIALLATVKSRIKACGY